VVATPASIGPASPPKKTAGALPGGALVFLFKYFNKNQICLK